MNISFEACVVFMIYFGALFWCFFILVRFLGEVDMVLDNLVQKVREQVRDRFEQANQTGAWQELDKNLQAVLQEVFAKMELVTREEFDRQAQLLGEARMKLQMLEKQLKSLENQIK
ncbi:MAG TPA: accessory factor UbiK family protein [Agitococcus sp.]|nr:accessory factor UbiK family protein [Agitococcus sp.]